MELVKSKVIFNEENHSYRLGDKYLQGITWILSKYIKPQKYEGIPEYILQRAANKGHAIHSEIEMYVNGFPPSECSEEYHAFVRGTDGMKFIASEYTVSDNSDFASKIDLVDDKLNLYDIKTTRTLDEELVSWQLSIYSYLFELQNKAMCGKLYGIWLRGDRCEIIEVKKIDVAVVIELLIAAKKGTQWKNPLLPDITIDENTLFQLREIEAEIARREEDVKNLKSEQEKIKEGLIEVMKQYGVKKYDGNKITLTYTAPTTKTTLDSKSLKELEPEIYQKFSKTSDVKESLRITIKK